MRLLLNSTVYKLFIRDHLPDLAFWTYIKALLLHQQQEIQDSKVCAMSLAHITSQRVEKSKNSVKSLGAEFYENIVRVPVTAGSVEIPTLRGTCFQRYAETNSNLFAPILGNR